MAECELLKTCVFFNDHMVDMPAMAKLYKQRYCLGDASECARYMVFSTLAGPEVPEDLFPNQRERAAKILEDA